MKEIIINIVKTSLNILNDTSGWLVLSFILAGLLRNLLSPKRFQEALGNRKFSSILKATISGVLLPICSCGVIPLGVSLYYSGAYLGPTLAFMTATPIINPIAMLLAIGMLGPKVGLIYIITGILAPIIIGLVGNHFAGDEISVHGLDSCAATITLEEEKESFLNKIKSGLIYGFTDLGFTVSKYVVPGILLAGILLILAPKQFISSYLGEPGLVSLGGIAVLSAIMYVCAVGHIPFIAALIAGGASPGTAITFLMAGAATNLPELISMYKLIGKRAAIIYCSCVTILSLISGYITNLILLPDFVPFVNLDKDNGAVKFANKIILDIPDPLKRLCSVVIVALFFMAIAPKIKSFILKHTNKLSLKEM